MAKDTPEDNRSWAAELGLDFPLLSDTGGEVTAAYDAQRDPGDKFAPYPQRITYLLDPEGVIRRAYEVTPDVIADHAATVAADLRALREG